MRTLRVRDIMTTEVISLRANASLEEAAAVLSARRISGAPVMEEARVVGVVSLSDLVHPLNRLADGAFATVGAVMTRVVYAVHPGDPVMIAVRLMVEENIHRAVVVGDDGSVVGMLSPMDVMRSLAHGDGVQDGDYAYDSQREVHSDPAVAVAFLEVRRYGIAS